MLKQKYLLTSGFVLLFLFLVFSFFIHLGAFRSFDFNTTVRIQDHVSSVFAFPFSTLSLIGSFEISSIILVLILLLDVKINRAFAILLCFLIAFVGLFGRIIVNNSSLAGFELASIIFALLLLFAFKAKRIFVILLYGLIAFAGLFGKAFINHPPPPFLFFKYDIPFLFPSSYVQPGFSYPSGHAGRTAFISIILLVLVINNKKLPPVVRFTLALLIIAFDVVMFISRIYLGEHWATDVIGGALLGMSFGLLSMSDVYKSASRRLSTILR